MSNLDREILNDIKNNLIDSIKCNIASTDSLSYIFKEIKEKTPDVFVEYKVDETCDAIDCNHLNWSSSYFSKQIVIAKRNFSIKRIEHLLTIREKFRQDGVKGFLPLSDKSKMALEKDTYMLDGKITSDNLKKSIDKKSISEIRTALRLDLNNNKLSKSNLINNISIVLKEDMGVFDPFVVNSLSNNIDNDKEKWTVSYYDSQITYLRMNFSEKRLRHLIDVREMFRLQGVEGFRPVSPHVKAKVSASNTQTEGEKRQGVESEAFEMNPMFKTALAIGGAIAALAVILIAIIR